MKKDEIAVSVFCLTYNHEKYIRDALEGFVRQKTDFSFEVFVHDDASTDGTAQIIKEYAQRYPDCIKPVFETENQYSKNGLEQVFAALECAAKGKYFALCEGDDFWNDPMKLQKQYDAMEQHPECSICVCKVRCCREDGVTPDEKVFPQEELKIVGTQVLSQDKMAELLFRQHRYPFHTSSYFYRAIAENDARKKNFIGNSRDKGFMKMCVYYGAYYYIDEPMSTRRLNAVNGWNSRMKEDRIRWIRLYLSDAAFDLDFDRITEHQFHPYIHPSAARRIYSFYRDLPDGVGRTARQYHLRFCDLGEEKTVKGRLRWLFVCYVAPICPKFAYRLFNRKKKDERCPGQMISNRQQVDYVR